jgi:hypothetical protein
MNLNKQVSLNIKIYEEWIAINKQTDIIYHLKNCSQETIDKLYHLCHFGI